MSIRSWGFAFLMVLVGDAVADSNTAIIVSAPRLDNLDLMDVSVAADVTVIDQDTLAQSGSSSVPQVLEQEANVLVRNSTGNPNDGQLSMRGFGDNSNLRVLVMVDGHKINRPDMGGIDWQTLPVSNVERIEVIRGGQNVLFGNHALSGVVKITTKRAADAGLQLDGAVGSFGYVSGGASYGDAAGDVDLSAGVNYYGSEGFRSNSTSRASTVHAGAGWYLNDTDVLTLRTSFSDGYVQFPGPITYEQMQADPAQSGNAGDQFSTTRSGLGTLLYEAEREWGLYRLNLGANSRRIESSISGQYAQNDQTGFSMAPRIRYGTEDDFWMTGFDAFYDQLDVENYLDEPRTIVESWAELGRITAAPYVFAQHTIGENTVVSGGARYEYAGTDNVYTEYVANQLSPFIGPFPNPNYKNPPDVDPAASFDGMVEKQGWAAECSVARQISEPLNVFAGYDRVYRYPTLDETASYQGFPLSNPLNEDLDPERGNNFELGAQFKGAAWAWSLTGFYLMLENEIAYDDLQKLNRNMGATRRLGAEVEASWKKPWYGASTRWTLVDARFDGGVNDGNKVPLVPWANGVMRAWVEPVSSLRLTAIYSVVSGQVQGNDESNVRRKMDPYGLFGLRANLNLSESLSAVFSLQNLFDETYASSAYSGGYYPGVGRSFRMGVTWDY